MDKLYRKITLPSGRVKYEESLDWDYGDPKPGLWLHTKQGSSHGYVWVSKYVGPVSGIPERLKDREALEARRQEILNRVNGTAAGFDAIVSACFDVLTGDEI